MIDNGVENNQGVVAENNSGNIIINNGISAEEAYKIATKLFEGNFYKLQDVAIQYVKERFDAFLNELRKELEKNHFEDYHLFEKPDMQYALYDCMNAYARYGDEVSLEVLIKLMSERLRSDKKFKVKVAIDDAIKIIPKIDQESLNYMTIMFAAKQVNFHLPADMATVVNHFNSLINTFCFEKNCSDFLNSLGCLKIDLDSALNRISKIYKVNAVELKKHLDEKYNLIHGDYSLTYPAIILAIVNFKSKSKNSHLNFDNWIR